MAEEVVPAGEVPTEMCLAFGLLFLIIFIILVYLLHRKKFITIIEVKDISPTLIELDALFRARGWKTKLDATLQKIKVTKDSLVAADIFLRGKRDGNIEVVSGSNTSELGWFIFVILLVGTTGPGGLVFILVIHHFSRKFAKKEISPLILNHPW